MITCLPSAPFFSAIFARFFSFTKTDEAARLLLLDGGAVAAGGVECWVERVLGMVVDEESLSIDKQSMMRAHHHVLSRGRCIASCLVTTHHRHIYMAGIYTWDSPQLGQPAHSSDSPSLDYSDSIQNTN